MKTTCRESGASVEEEKCEGPAMTLPFLGMELDTVKLEIRLPPVSSGYTKPCMQGSATVPDISAPAAGLGKNIRIILSD